MELQGILPTQGSNPGLLHCMLILYQLSHKGSPRIFDWVAYPFSRASSWPRNWTGVSCITGIFFTNWAIREAQKIHLQCRRPGFDPWVGKIPWRRKRLLTPVFWLREFHGLYSPWRSQRVGHDWATFTSLHFNHKCVMNFVKGFFSIYWDYHMIFTFQFVNMVYHIVCFAYIELLHSRNKPNLIMVAFQE